MRDKYLVKTSEYSIDARTLRSQPATYAEYDTRHKARVGAKRVSMENRGDPAAIYKKVEAVEISGLVVRAT